MPLQAPEVRVGITGELFKAPLGTAPPATPTGALDPAFTGLGYVSDDGVTENWDDSVDNIVAWQNATVVRAAVTESVGTLGLMLIQTNVDVLEAFHRGSTMSSPSAGVFELEVKPITSDPATWVLNVVDGTINMRIYVGNGEVTERGEIAYANGQPIGFPLTITFYPDTDGNLLRKLSDDAAWTPGT